MPVFISVNSIAIAPRGNVVMLFTMKGISTHSIYSELCLQCNAWQVVVKIEENKIFLQCVKFRNNQC